MFVLSIPEDLIPTVFDHLAALPPAIASRVLVGACGLDEAEPAEAEPGPEPTGRMGRIDAEITAAEQEARDAK
jgi:hypothetical protein